MTSDETPYKESQQHLYRLRRFFESLTCSFLLISFEFGSLNIKILSQYSQWSRAGPRAKPTGIILLIALYD